MTRLFCYDVKYKKKTLSLKKAKREGGILMSFNLQLINQLTMHSYWSHVVVIK